MKWLVVICDGETEADFCKQVLKSHLCAIGYEDVHANLISKYNYDSIKRDVVATLKQYRWTAAVVTSMHDLYKLPANFPGTDLSKYSKSNPAAYVERLEQAYEGSIQDTRFVAYIQLHEFETLLFADLGAFRPEFEKCDMAIRELEKAVKKFASIDAYR